MEKLSKVLLGHRKPAILWRKFKELFGMLKISGNGGRNTNIEHITYSRYETGYNFQDEREARWVTEERASYLPFEGKDILKLIVPNSKIGTKVEAALKFS